jgi:hypothetical protein
MSARSKRYRKSRGPFVATPLAIMNTKAWRTMSLGARLLHIQLRCRLRNDGLNNGSIFESCRGAAEKMGVNRNSIAHWYHELEHYGFIRKTAPGFLGGDGHGIATRYRFTDLAYGTRPATRDYEAWDGEVFDRKEQNPVLPNRTPRPTKEDIRKANGKGAVCPTKRDIGEALRCPTKEDISRLPSPVPGDDRIQGSLTVRAPAQAGGAGSSPAPVASKPVSTSPLRGRKKDRGVRSRVLELLAGGPKTVKEIMLGAGVRTRAAADALLYKLFNEGRVLRVGHGVYQLMPRRAA